MSKPATGAEAGNAGADADNAGKAGNAGAAGGDGEGGAPAIGDFLADERVVIDLEVSSRKRLFEAMANLVASPSRGGGADVDTVLGTLTKREKLGSTGIGNGIALPHGRIEGLAEPVMAAARLKHGIEYDAPDGAPVWLAVCLLAPLEADRTHLRLLAALAARFNTPGFPERLRQAQTARELAAHFKEPRAAG